MMETEAIRSIMTTKSKIIILGKGPAEKNFWPVFMTTSPKKPNLKSEATVNPIDHSRLQRN